MATIVSLNWKINLEIDRDQVQALTNIANFWTEMTGYIRKNWPTEITQNDIDKATAFIHELRQLQLQDKAFVDHIKKFKIQ